MGHTVSKGYQIRQGLSERFCFSYLIVQQRSAQAAIVKKTMSRMHPTIRYEDRCNKSSLVSIWKKKKKENENKCKLLALQFVLQKVFGSCCGVFRIKVENISKGSLNLITLPSPIQIVGGKAWLRCTLMLIYDSRLPVLWSKWPLASSLLQAIKTCRQACPPGYLMHFS